MIRGTLSDFSLAEIIRLIAQTRRSGVLEIAGPTGNGRVLFSNGAICGAETSRSREPLGRKLVRLGALTESQLWNALSRQDKTHHRLGETLVASGIAAAEIVHTALREQVRDSIVDVLRLELTEFTWRSEAPEDPVVFPVDELLDALAESVEEIKTIREHIPSEGSTVTLAPSPPTPEEIRLTHEEWRLMVFLGSRRKVRDLLRYSGSGETQTLRSLDRLVEKGLLEVDDPATLRHASAAQASGSVRVRSAPPPPPRSVPSQRRVIRLSDSGKTSVLERDTFGIAFLGQDPHGLSERAGAIFGELAGDVPVSVTTLFIGDPREASATGQAQEPHPLHQLKPRGLAHMDLVICFDWSQVESAVSIGAAPPERTFTLLELWALIDPLGSPAHGIQRAHEAVERANSRRFRKAALLSNLEMPEAKAPGDEQERLSEVCADLAWAMFG